MTITREMVEDLAGGAGPPIGPVCPIGGGTCLSWM
jgi:hypothetical protein